MVVPAQAPAIVHHRLRVVAKRQPVAKPILPIYITPEGHKKVKDEFDQLWKVERPRVTHEVETAAAHGDRSENAEYQYGKRRLREIDRRLKFLSDRLERMKIVHPESQRDNGTRIGFGAWVVVEDEDGGKHTYRVIGPDETDADRGLISMDSPMGRALMGREPDDEITVQRPRGPASFVILSVHYGDQPKV
jgi:transcription elongation factor GreB